jgi:DNA polymerase III subunit epsilon
MCLSRQSDRIEHHRPIRERVTSRCDARRVGAWTTGELLGFDLETTGVDRFNDVPVSYALAYAVSGRIRFSWSGLIDPGRDIPEEATAVHGISSAQARSEGMPLGDAVALIADVVLSASRRRVPLLGMQLDFDLTMLEVQARRHLGCGIVERGWFGPVLDAAVLDRHYDPGREGRRTLGALCAHYGTDIGQAHDACDDAIASMKVLFAMAEGCRGLRDRDPSALHRAQIHWHREWEQRCDGRRQSDGTISLDPRDQVWPVAPVVAPAA